MAHKGMREWTSEELSGIALGQNGFHVLKGNTERVADDYGIEYWVAIKAIDGSCPLEAQSLLNGHHLSTTGDYGSGDFITLADGDITYGAFDKIDINGTTKYVIAYIGK